MVPHDYVIPSTENVPKVIHGLKLGKRVVGMRSKEAYLSDPETQGERREWLNSLGFMYHTSNAAIHLQRSGIDVTKWTAAELCDRYLVQLKTKFDKFKNLTAGRMEEDIRQLKLGQGLSDPWTYQVKPSLQFTLITTVT